MASLRNQSQAKGKSKDFLDELRAFADEQRSLIDAECDGFSTDHAERDRRAARAQNDYEFFVNTYFPHYIKSQSSEFHEWFFVNVPKLIDDPAGKLIDISAPRGEAKSTLGTQLVTIWCIVTGRKKFMPIVMDSFGQAATMLEAIKVELTNNPRLAMDFPDATGQGRVWNTSAIVTANNVKLQAFGRGTNMRGIRHGPHRPDMVLLDDIENDENVRKPEQRKKTEDWVNKMVLPLGPPEGSMDVLYLNTILHYDSVANRIHRNARWIRIKFKSIKRWPDRMDLWQQWEEVFMIEGEEAADAFYAQNEVEMNIGVQVSWPSMRPILKLMKIRAGDHHAFDCEYQNDPTNEENATFTGMQFWHSIVFTKDWVHRGVLDPSLGKSATKGDPCCILVGASRRDQLKLHIVEADLARMKPDKQIEKLIAYQAAYNCLVWGVEDTAFQEYFRQQIVEKSAARHMPVPAIGIRNDRDKDILIEAVAPHVNNGLILFHQSHTVFNENVKHYPEAAHDDGPDGLQMLWKLFMRGAGGLPKLRMGPRTGSTAIDYPR